MDSERRILAVVAQVPCGQVATYGQIAELAGLPRAARLVGRVLAHARSHDVPCHRIVNHAGRLAPGWPEQAQLLRREGVALTACADGPHADLHRFRWKR